MLREVVRVVEWVLDGYLVVKVGVVGKGEEKKINGVKKVLNGGYVNGNGIEIEVEGLRVRGMMLWELSGEMGGDMRV